MLGRVVEVVSGQPLDAFLAEHVLGPLGHDRHRFLGGRAEDLDRLAALYLPNPRGGLSRSAAMGDAVTRPPTFLSGGGGLVSTAADYHRFTQMLARGGELGGVRLLSPRTVAYMARNHLPGNVDLEAFGRPVFAESTVRGVGFGLGVSVVIDAAAVRGLTSVGEYAWGGLASTAFYVDPVEEITRDVLHPADALEHLSHPQPAAHAGQPRRWWTDGPRSSGSSSSRSACGWPR